MAKHRSRLEPPTVPACAIGALNVRAIHDSSPALYDPRVLRPGFGGELCLLVIRFVYTTLVVDWHQALDFAE